MAESVDELMRKAGAAHVAGRLPEAERLVAQVLTVSPENLEAHLLMGVLAGKTGRNEEALKHFERVLAENPSSFEAVFWLSLLYRRQKNLEQAIRYGERAVQLRPDDPFAHNNLGLCFLDQMRLEESILEFQRTLKAQPDSAPTLHNLGTALYLTGRDMEAAQAFDRSLVLAPGSLDSYLSLGQVLLSQTNPGQAAKCARRALQINPNSAGAHLLLASALVEDSLTGEAEQHLKKAIQLNPQDHQAHGLLGQRLQSLGNFEEANSHLKRSLEIEPRQGFAYFAYVYNNKLTEKDRPLVQKMEDLVVEQGLDPRQTMFLNYALARSYESLGEYERAMHYLDEVNRIARKLKFGDQVFDREAYAQGFDWLIETFSQSFIEKNRGKGNPSQAPIVIVGMMRSGTTLVEQILSSHSQIGAAGENRFWPMNRRDLFGAKGRSLNSGELPEFGRRYVEALKKVVPGKGYITDKMPANYEMLGAIHTALPNAKIIHMRRHPVDTCISIYATPNRVPIDYAYDRENIVFAYEQYLRLMEHWRTVLPTDRFLEVNYEDIVHDRETQSRKMLELIGLDWEEALMHHEQNQRNVITPSLWQVRQPIYTSSVERWRRYEPWLGAFKRLMPEDDAPFTSSTS